MIFLCAACIPHVSGRVFCFSSVSVFHMCACFFDELAVGFANSQREDWKSGSISWRKPRQECTREGDRIRSHRTTYFKCFCSIRVCAIPSGCHRIRRLLVKRRELAFVIGTDIKGNCVCRCLRACCCEQRGVIQRFELLLMQKRADRQPH